MDHETSSPQASNGASAQVEARVRASFKNQSLMDHLGAELIRIAPGEVRIRLPHRPELTQQHGYVHAGATSTIADSAGGLAALTHFDAGQEVLTVEYKINLLAPAAGQYIEAVGTVLRSGHTLSVCRLEAFAVDHDRRTLIAAGQQTLIRVPAQK
ncbi:PaaI family thioesterase [Antribacter sp. KLBMP9083]|uniref:Medium/long-chain acyl-CoA thioesterase YigI n=1 Tax=Antribacter soli TaxID=2910976 RepID=A0AA41UDH3_9MICO|nr:PaaI family thioesterase [Antribacter soli]MCF4123089.1 PaaI family thioesterase [Antribacter soli]